jgi:crotonobetainyl-CoA:carnitine CoA-transferase CaiB-like acyl-CoA transferase
VNTVYDMFWHSTHIAFTANRGKQSISINLKDPRGLAVLHELVKRADVVQHNMRYEAAVRLGIDYESLVEIKPDLIYCHSSGFDKSRAHLPGNDQTGACLAGVEYEDGGMADGGKPLWSLTSFGDTGNGFLAAIAIIQAITHREVTGEGQFLSTSILAACLLNSSYAWVNATNGEGIDRPSGSGEAKAGSDSTEASERGSEGSLGQAASAAALDAAAQFAAGIWEFPTRT